MRKKLPVIDETILDRVGIATPCSADWNDMQGDAQIRRCGSCRLDVYDISAMTRSEAAAFLTRRAANRGARTCVRLFRRTDGTLLTADCWEQLRAARRRGVWAFAAAVLVVGFSQIALRVAGVTALFRESPSLLPDPIESVMGEMTPPEQPPEPSRPIEPEARPVMVPSVGPLPQPIAQPEAAPPVPSTKKPIPPHRSRKPTPAKPEFHMMGKMTMGDVSID